MFKEVTLMGSMDNGHELYQTELGYTIDISKPLTDNDIVDIVETFESETRAKCTYFHVAEIEFDEAITNGYIEYDEKNEKTIFLNDLYCYVDWSFTEKEIKQAFKNVSQSAE